MTHRISSLFIQKFMYSTASAVLTCRPSGVARVDVRGLVMPAVLQQLRDDLLVHVRRPLWAWCVELERATLAVDAEQLDALTKDVRPDSPLKACAAVVVAPGAVALMQAHARSMAQRGVGRRVFTSLVEARAWAENQARLWKAQAEWEDLQRSMAASRPSLSIA